MKLLTQVSFAALLAGSCTLASALPEACPSVSAIQHITLSNVIYFHEGYYVYQTSQFDTPEHWNFTIGPFTDAQSPQDAIKKATAALEHITNQPKPEPIIGEPESAVCTYATPGPYHAFAYEPASSFRLQP